MANTGENDQLDVAETDLVSTEVKTQRAAAEADDNSAVQWNSGAHRALARVRSHSGAHAVVMETFDASNGFFLECLQQASWLNNRQERMPTAVSTPVSGATSTLAEIGGDAGEPTPLTASGIAAGLKPKARLDNRSSTASGSADASKPLSERVRPKPQGHSGTDNGNYSTGSTAETHTAQPPEQPVELPGQRGKSATKQPDHIDENGSFTGEQHAAAAAFLSKRLFGSGAKQWFGGAVNSPQHNPDGSHPPSSGGNDSTVDGESDARLKAPRGAKSPTASPANATESSIPPLVNDTKLSTTYSTNRPSAVGIDNSEPVIESGTAPPSQPIIKPNSAPTNNDGGLPTPETPMGPADSTLANLSTINIIPAPAPSGKHAARVGESGNEDALKVLRSFSSAVLGIGSSTLLPRISGENSLRKRLAETSPGDSVSNGEELAPRRHLDMNVENLKIPGVAAITNGLSSPAPDKRIVNTETVFAAAFQATVVDTIASAGSTQDQSQSLKKLIGSYIVLGSEPVVENGTVTAPVETVRKTGAVIVTTGNEVLLAKGDVNLGNLAQRAGLIKPDNLNEPSDVLRLSTAALAAAVADTAPELAINAKPAKSLESQPIDAGRFQFALLRNSLAETEAAAALKASAPVPDQLIHEWTTRSWFDRSLAGTPDASSEVRLASAASGGDSAMDTPRIVMESGFTSKPISAEDQTASGALRIPPLQGSMLLVAGLARESVDASAFLLVQASAVGQPTGKLLLGEVIGKVSLSVGVGNEIGKLSMGMATDDSKLAQSGELGKTVLSEITRQAQLIGAGKNTNMIAVGARVSGRFPGMIDLGKPGENTVVPGGLEGRIGRGALNVSLVPSAEVQGDRSPICVVGYLTQKGLGIVTASVLDAAMPGDRIGLIINKGERSPLTEAISIRTGDQTGFTLTISTATGEKTVRSGKKKDSDEEATTSNDQGNGGLGYFTANQDPQQQDPTSSGQSSATDPQSLAAVSQIDPNSILPGVTLVMSAAVDPTGSTRNTQDPTAVSPETNLPIGNATTINAAAATDLSGIATGYTTESQAIAAMPLTQGRLDLFAAQLICPSTVSAVANSTEPIANTVGNNDCHVDSSMQFMPTNLPVGSLTQLHPLTTSADSPTAPPNVYPANQSVQFSNADKAPTRSDAHALPISTAHDGAEPTNSIELTNFSSCEAQPSVRTTQDQIVTVQLLPSSGLPPTATQTQGLQQQIQDALPAPADSCSAEQWVSDPSNQSDQPTQFGVSHPSIQINQSIQMNQPDQTNPLVQSIDSIPPTSAEPYVESSYGLNPECASMRIDLSQEKVSECRIDKNKDNRNNELETLRSWKEKEARRMMETLMADQATRKDQRLFVEEEVRTRYVVRPGDTLESIAANVLGDSRLALLIFRINRPVIRVEYRENKQIVHLKSNTVLQVPTRTEIELFRATMSNKKPKRPRQSTTDISTTSRISYTVRLGDTLRTIAARHAALQDGSLWTLVAEINGLSTNTDTTGAPIARVQRGTTLILPSGEEISAFRTRQNRQHRMQYK